jgi:ribosomal protein L18E
MIKLRLLQPGQPDVEVVVEGDSAVIGRDETCDVVVPQPFVSKRHLQLMKGLVLVDLRSSNGTFVKGEKVTKPVLLKEGLFNLADRLDIAVVADEPAATHGGLLDSRVDELTLVRGELESTRARGAVLSNEVSVLRRREQHGSEEADGKLGALQAENQDLRLRLESLKDEIEGREVDAAASLQARLAGEQLREVQRKNLELAARVRELEARPRASSAEARSAPSQEQELESLRAELARARQASLPPSEFFAQLQRESEELRARLSAFESGQVSPSLPASQLFFELQAENRDLRRRVEELEASPPTKTRAKPAGSRDKASPAELERVRADLQRAEAELASLRGASQVQGGAATGSAGTTLGILRLLAERDLERIEADKVFAAEEFVVLEALRFLRGAEKLVTRAAGEMIQLYHQQTKLPDVGGNFRSLTRGVLDDPDGRGPRGELARYLEQLSRWLVVSLGAHRKAALEFVAQLKQELSEQALSEKRAMPALRIVAGQREAELWRRVCEHLKELSPEIIEDRIEKLSRDTAGGLLDLPQKVT